ncbi:hypothetical protein GGR20_002841 [Devosia subaequoris]|uniref:Uncharacterized protein n=1 Tax=Devosia subaequoris TaxID=395930 RepID=A0A7W6NC27_9HYPH|nr:hypothetical protein [Devosia subaequoris]MBB4053184.1 hypothetical protein [Devosia subaequoris]MCP1210684.1 hypothetical protein [Devosia subaequoris]
MFFVALMGGLAIFQGVLIAGAPLGHFAWGGQHRILPRRLRIGSAVAIVLYGLFALILMMRVGLLAPWPDTSWIKFASWVILAYMALGVVMNAISRSLPERLTMTPLVAVLLGLTLIVALS